MSALVYVARIALPAALTLLETVAGDLRHPAAGRLNSPEARALLLAIGLQESRFEHRFQIRGPAHGFWQGEYGGGGWTLTLAHPASAPVAHEVLKRLAYGEPDINDYKGTAHNDILACSMARLLLWTHPLPLPRPGYGEETYAWQYYLDTWNPGIPHPETWAEMWRQAWDALRRF